MTLVPNNDPAALRRALEQERAASEKLADKLNAAYWMLQQLDKILTDSQRLWLTMQLGDTGEKVLSRARSANVKTTYRRYVAP